MDAWAEHAPPSLLAKRTLLDYTDPLLAPLLEAKKTLQNALEESENDTENRTLALFKAVCDGDLVTTEAIARTNPESLDSFFPDENGVPCLVFAVAFDHYPVAEALLANHSVDPDTYDRAVNYTALMWAVHFANLPMVKLLLEYQADPYLAPKEKNAVSLVTLESPEIYDFFRSHNLTLAASPGDDFGYLPQDDGMDDLSHQFRLTLGTASSDPSEERQDLDEEAELARDTQLVQAPDYDYDKIRPEQFIKFTDSDIPSLLDYIFGLRTHSTALQHATKIPAAILFQLVRYSHFKVDSKDLTEFAFECFVTRLRSVTDTKSGVFNMAITDQGASGGAGDIVLLSYWLSVIQFLHFYFSRSRVYEAYPKFLQELVNLTQSLVATLSFSINTRLNLLVDECLLNFTNLVDVSSVLYAKDWNLFKNKKKHPSSYDDILDMLFPPSEMELMKPSPLRYVQVLGALDYVLKLHAVDPLLRFQTFSQVFYYINAVLFNRLIASSKHCSRAKAIQIRLNVSTLEDWLRSHNYRIYKPDRIGGLSLLLGQESAPLHNLLEENDSFKDPHSLSFHYKSLYHVGKSQLSPTIELLQWLQCMSGLADEESLINTINQFDALNYFQILKVPNKLYRYEIEEKKMPKPLLQLLKRLVAEQGETQVSLNSMHYMTQSNFLLKEVYIYLNPNYVFGVALPNLSELIVNYGAGLGGVKLLRAKKFQPTLPISVMDDVDEILSGNKNANVNDTYDYEEESEEEPEEKESEAEPQNGPVTGNPGAKAFKGDELFKQVQVPLSLVYKNWGDDEIVSNPW